MKVGKLTPVLIVEAIEPCMAFWMDRLGFTKTVEVPHGEQLGFVILVRDGVEVMYQTRASVQGDVAPLADTPLKGNLLYFEVDDLDAVENALDGVPLVIPRRTTFYGAQEIIVREPAGNAIAFAQFASVPA
jgi:uncharacterized glyoxalase superfamily protein PhnB